MSDQKLDNSVDNVILEGLQKSAQILKNTVTTVQVQDVSVTITAEPKVIDIRITQGADIKILPEKLMQCLNEAFKKSIEKVLEQAASEV